MQVATSTLESAIQARERQPVATLEADWLRNGTWTWDPGVFRDTFIDTFEGVGNLGDLTPLTANLSVDRSLSSDLPADAKLTSGYGAAVASATLAGTFGGLPISQVFSAHDNPLTLYAPRIAVPVRMRLGMRGSAGVETLPLFVGRVSEISVDPRSAEVRLSMIDSRADITTPVALPLKAGTDPGLDGASFAQSIVNAQEHPPTATYETSLNTLTATPTIGTVDPWALLQLIAEAEQGLVLFDESGVLRFYNRNHLSGGAAVATVTTVGSTPNLLALSSTESAESVRNYITVAAIPYTLDPPGTDLWLLSEVLSVPAGGGTIQVPADLPGAPYTITAVNYTANTAANGSGSAVVNLFVFATVGAGNVATVTVYNPNPFDIYLVDTAGEPTLRITGRAVREGSPYTAVASDSGSRSVYGTRVLEIGGNPFLQSSTVATALAGALKVALREPHPVLEGVQIVGDPRLQLGDRVRVVEPDGLAVDSEFWLIAIQTSFSASDGLVQSVSLREA